MSYQDIQRRIRDLEEKQQALEEVRDQIIESFDKKIRPIIYEKKTLLYNNPQDLLEIIEKYFKLKDAMVKTVFVHTGTNREFADSLSLKIFGKGCKDIEPFEHQSYGYGTLYDTLEFERNFHFKKIEFNGDVILSREELKTLRKYEIEMLH